MMKDSPSESANAYIFLLAVATIHQLETLHTGRVNSAHGLCRFSSQQIGQCVVKIIIVRFDFTSPFG